MEKSARREAVGGRPAAEWGAQQMGKAGVSGAAGAPCWLRTSEKGFGVLSALVSLSSFLFFRLEALR